jgi:hypothetical protein
MTQPPLPLQRVLFVYFFIPKAGRKRIFVLREPNGGGIALVLRELSI